MKDFKFLRGYPEKFRLIVTDEQRAEFERILGTNPCREVPINRENILIRYRDGEYNHSRPVHYHAGRLLQPNERLYTFSGTMFDFFQFYQIGIPLIYSISRRNGNHLDVNYLDVNHLPIFTHIFYEIRYVITSRDE
jgi:hypothetical protein